MAISRMQEPRQLYGLGSLVKGVKKAVKGVVKGVKDNPLLAAAALNFAPMLVGSKPFFGLGLTKGQFGLPAMFSNAVEGYKKLEGPQKFLAQAGIATALSGGLAALAQEDQEEQEVITRDVGSLREYLTSYYSNLGYTADQIAENVARDTSEYNMADGGRIGYSMGTGEKVEMAAGIEGLPININPKGVKELDLRETGGFIAPVGVKEKADDIPAMLSNNEFVFTADAVRAAGGGSVDKGAQIMYDTMKKLESKVV